MHWPFLPSNSVPRARVTNALEAPVIFFSPAKNDYVLVCYRYGGAAPNSKGYGYCSAVYAAFLFVGRSAFFN